MVFSVCIYKEDKMEDLLNWKSVPDLTVLYLYCTVLYCIITYFYFTLLRIKSDGVVTTFW